MARYITTLSWMIDDKRVHSRIYLKFINFCIIFIVIIAGYVPFINTFVEYDTDTVRRIPACQSKCSVSIPRSSVGKFNSFSLESIQLLFVHFSGYNLSLEPSTNTDILDPLNLVWTKSNEAPLMYLDLGFNLYSFMTLSRVVHHMKVKVEVEPINCLQNMTNSCVTANLARAFLSNVTKEKGVLCYAVNDENRVNYRCCKGNVHTQQVECDVTAVPSPETTTIFISIAIAALIFFLCFPALFDIVLADKENSETLSSNIKVYNPLSRFIIKFVHSLGHYSTKYYCVNVLRNLFIALALPTLYYIDYGLQLYTMTYDIPEMFNDAVKEVWVASKVSSVHGSMGNPALVSNEFVKMIFFYLIFVVIWCFLPRIPSSGPKRWSGPLTFGDTFKTKIFSLLEKEKAIEVNWREPRVWTKDFFCWLRSLFGKAMGSERSFCSRCAIFLGSVVLMALSPVITLLIFVSYTGYVSPLGKAMRLLVYYAPLYFVLYFEKYGHSNYQYAFGCVGCVGFVIACSLFTVAFGPIFYRSLLLPARLIVYLWLGLVASKDHYFPRITMFFICVYYSCNCVSSVKSKYHILLKQTFVKCKDYQEKHPNERKALTFDDKRVPRISSELFQDVIDQILPRSEVYTHMILKLTVINLFLLLTFMSILVIGKSNLDESTKALAVFLTGLLPKLFEIFGEGSSYQQLCEAENSYRVEKIVEDFFSRSHNANPDDDTPQNHNAEQSTSNPSNDQSPTTITRTRERKGRNLDIEMAVISTMEQNIDC